MMTEKQSVLLNFFAGCLGGCSGIIIGHPFDTVKVRLQVPTHVTAQHYTSAIKTCTHIMKSESIRGLYKGLSFPLAGQALINAIIFGVEGTSKKLFNPARELPTLKVSILSGILSGTAQSFACSPIEMIKIRMQMQNVGVKANDLKKIRPLNLFLEIFRKEGFRGVYHGLSLTMMREIPAFAVYFACFDSFCKMFLKPGQTEIDEVSIPVMLLGGGLTGCATWLVSYPIDVIKSRLQAQSSSDRSRYRGMVHCAKAIFKGQGLKGFSMGLGVTLFRAFPVNAVTFSTVNIFINYMRKFETRLNIT